MKKLTTKQEIINALNTIAPDQAKVIHEIASNRNLDPNTLTNYQYYILIKLEADFSLDDPTPDTEQYVKKLHTLANKIDTTI